MGSPKIGVFSVLVTLGGEYLPGPAAYLRPRLRPAQRLRPAPAPAPARLRAAPAPAPAPAPCLCARADTSASPSYAATLTSVPMTRFIRP